MSTRSNPARSGASRCRSEPTTYAPPHRTRTATAAPPTRTATTRTAPATEDGETVEAAALRETLEESGLVVELRRSLGLRGSELIRRDRHLEDLRFDIHRFVATSRTDRIQLSDEHVAFRWLTREAASSAAAILPGGLAGDITGELLRRFAEGELEPDERVS